MSIEQPKPKTAETKKEQKRYAYHICDDSEWEDVQYSDFAEFNTDIIPPHGLTAIIYGLRSSGKTTLVHSLVHQIHKKVRKYTAVFLFSHTAHIQANYLEFIPPSNRFTSLDNLKHILEHQIKIIEHNKQAKNKKERRRSTILLILDDLVSDRNVHKDPTLKKLFVQGRHYSEKKSDSKIGSLIDTFVLSQSVTGIHPLCRVNCDFCFSARQDSLRQRKALIEEYLTLGNSMMTGFRIFKAITSEPFGFVCIFVTKSNKNSYFCYCFTAKAKLKNGKLPVFKIGDRLQWGGKK